MSLLWLCLHICSSFSWFEPGHGLLLASGWHCTRREGFGLALVLLLPTPHSCLQPLGTLLQHRQQGASTAHCAWPHQQTESRGVQKELIPPQLSWSYSLHNRN